ncbi:MAG: hypothetical protein IJG38_05345 [Thermoguttaceae bacterium]|nr:hypothetical protein [Thermoguttaceae bacterium]
MEHPAYPMNYCSHSCYCSCSHNCYSNSSPIRVAVCSVHLPFYAIPVVAVLAPVVLAPVVLAPVVLAPVVLAPVVLAPVVLAPVATRRRLLHWFVVVVPNNPY